MTAIRVPRPMSLPPPTDRLVVVEASAGTGKTFFLEHRVVDLILAGAELSQILLVTFTDKAVAELRLRIRDVLDRLARATDDQPADSAWEIDDDGRRRLRAAVTAFDHAPIFTIHGFCHRVLIEDAFAARRLFDQTQIADELAFDAAFTALLRERFARDPSDRDLLAAYLETGKTVDELRVLLLGCLRADAQVRRHLDPEAARAAAQALIGTLGASAQRQALLAPIRNGNDRRHMSQWLDDIAVELDRGAGARPIAHVIAMLDAVRVPLEKLHDKLVDLGARAGATTELLATLRDVLGTVSLGEAIAAQLLPPIVDRIGRDKAERGLFDYDDMLELVWDALRGDRGEDLAQRLRTRTPWVMIDEFQDTDPVQWNIFSRVWLHRDARGLTIVGDPKQAIYGFRGADVQTYLAARDEMLRNGATRVPLSVNRRSTSQLVEAVNHVLVGNIGFHLLDQGGIAYDEPVTASGDVVCADARPPVCALQLSGGGRGQTDAARAALATAIGDEIEALRAAPPAWSSRGVAQAFSLGDVLVLTRANRDSSEIAGALRSRGLPCALVEPERLFRTREATELANVLAAIAMPRDRSARMRALRTRFFDVPWADLARVVDGPDHQPQIAQLFEWAQLANRRAYEQLFRRVVEDSRFAERALVLGGGERALTNTWHLIELLLAAVARSRSDLHEVVSQLRRWMLDETSQPDERDVQRAETDVEAIRILTIHKAKGLEAPYVFVFGGMSGIPRSPVRALRDPAGRALVVGTPDPHTKLQLEAEAEAENQRLAYVALTRAQVRLYLPLYADGQLNRLAGYGPVQRCLAQSVHARAAHTRPLFEVRAVPLDATDLPAPPSDALANFRAPEPPALAELAALPSERGGLSAVSYTRIAKDLDQAALAARPGDVLALEAAELRADDTVGEVAAHELPPGSASGLLLHDLLERADLDHARLTDFEAWSATAEVAAQVTERARERGIAREHHRHALELVHATLTRPLVMIDGASLPSIIDATQLAREVEFAFPLPDRRGLVRGFIDALVAYDDELWVLDYKSDLLAGDDLGRAADLRVREHYAVQARLYGLAADRMRGTRRFAGLLFAFVRHGVVVPVRLGVDTLAIWSAWLGGLSLAEVTA